MKPEFAALVLQNHRIILPGSHPALSSLLRSATTSLNPRQHLLQSAFSRKSSRSRRNTQNPHLLLAWLFVALGFGEEALRVSLNGVSHSQLCFARIDTTISRTQFGKAVWADIRVANRLGSD